MAAEKAGAGEDALADGDVLQVVAVGQLAGVAVDRREDVLVDGLARVDEGAGAPVELPEDAVLADGEEPPLAVGDDEHALVDDGEVEGLARRVLEVPLDLLGVALAAVGAVMTTPLATTGPAFWRKPCV